MIEFDSRALRVPDRADGCKRDGSGARRGSDGDHGLTERPVYSRLESA
jgi:hypothetical protein